MAPSCTTDKCCDNDDDPSPSCRNGETEEPGTESADGRWCKLSRLMESILFAIWVVGEGRTMTAEEEDDGGGLFKIFLFLDAEVSSIVWWYWAARLLGETCLLITSIPSASSSSDSSPPLGISLTGGAGTVLLLMSLLLSGDEAESRSWRPPSTR